MKKICKVISFVMVLILFFSVEVSRSKDVLAYAYTTLYLEVGESYVVNVTSNKPILDAYGDTDEAVAPAKWNSSDLSKRTKFTITAKSTGTATYYVCKDGKSDESHRVRTVKVYVYAKASNTSLRITNSTSKTNGTYLNMPIYLYTTKTSKCTLSQTNAFPISVSGDTSGKAKAVSASFVSNNTKIATVDNNGVVTAVAQGWTTITAKRSWTTSAGNTKTISVNLSVYVKTLPVLSVYQGTNVISSLKITTIDKPALTYRLSNLQSTDTVASVICTSADTNKFTVFSSNGSFIITPKNITNGIGVNVIFKVIINGDIRSHNGDAAATFTKSVPVTIETDKTIYVTNVSFSDNTVSLVKGDTYRQQATVSPDNASNKTVRYSTTNTEVATVDGNGNITAVGCGQATITATSVQVSFKSDNYKITVKEKPTEITHIENTGKGLKFEWNEIKDALGYQIYRCTDKNGSYSLIKTVTGTTYTDESGKYGTRYYYKIKTIPAEGNNYVSGFSNIVTDKKMLEIPQIKSISKKYGQYQIKMSESANCDGYVIYSGNSSKKAIVTTTSRYATVSLSNGTCYLSARAYKSVDGKKVYSEYSNTVEVKVSGSSVTVKKKYKLGKTQIKKITKKKNALRIKIKKVKNASGYTVKYSTSKKFKKAKSIKFKNTTYKINNLKTKKKYYIKVRAYRVVNGKKYYSAYSKTKSGKTN